MRGGNNIREVEREGKRQKSIMFDVSVSPWQQMLVEKPCEMTLGASCNVISTMCEYEISNGFEHIRAVFICSIYSPLVSNAIC